MILRVEPITIIVFVWVFALAIAAWFADAPKGQPESPPKSVTEGGQ